MKLYKKIIISLIFIFLTFSIIIVTKSNAQFWGSSINMFFVIVDEDSETGLSNVNVDWQFKGADSFHIDEANNNVQTINLTTNEQGITTKANGIKVYSQEHNGSFIISNTPDGYEDNVRINYKMSEVESTDGSFIPTFTFLEGNSYIKNVNTSEYDTEIIIQLKKENPINTSMTTISGEGKVFNVVSNKESDTSISVKDTIKKFQDEGLNVTNIKNNNNQDVSLTSTELIGTGYKIITDQGDYTSIVYGDITGDGLINAADIGGIINDFLGNSSVGGINKIAGDIYQDGNLNAADIGLMINSFLGTLGDSILIGDVIDVEPQVQGTLLSEIAKIGDYINYPILYENIISYEKSNSGMNEQFRINVGGLSTLQGWRILSNSNGIVKIITNGTPDQILLNGTAGNNIINTNNYLKYVDSNYAINAIGSANFSEVDDAEKSGYNMANGTVWALTNPTYDGWLQYYYTGYPDGTWNGYGFGAGSGIYIGIRPVVTLQSDLIAINGDGSIDNPWQLSK